MFEFVYGHGNGSRQSLLISLVWRDVDNGGSLVGIGNGREREREKERKSSGWMQSFHVELITDLI